MRPLIALIVAAVVLGSVSLFIKHQSRILVEKAAPRASQVVKGRLDVEITLTFDAGPDAFALQGTDAPSLIVEHLGNAILSRTDEITAGKPITISDIANIEQGGNSFVVRCTPQDKDPEVAHAIRVRVLRDGQPIADESIWSAPGEPCEGIVEVEL